MNHENPYTLTMQTTAAHAWDEGFEAGRIAERGRLAGEVTDVIDRLAAEAGSKRARTSQLHRIVTLDVAIEAVREAAACGVAAERARLLSDEAVERAAWALFPDHPKPMSVHGLAVAERAILAALPPERTTGEGS